MKNVILICLVLLMHFELKAQQQDTLFSNNHRFLADTVFGLLNINDYNGILLNRSFTPHTTTIEQRMGNYRHIHDAMDFLGMYSDVAYAYVDSTKMFNNKTLIDTLYALFDSYNADTNDILVQPFGLVLHNTYQLRLDKTDSINFSNSNSQLNPLIAADSIYENIIIKTGSLLEFYSDNGYDEGFIKYSPALISVSEDITDLSIMLNVVSGYQIFNEANNTISYYRFSDSILGSIALSYSLNGDQVLDTLSFYLTKHIGEKNTKSDDDWDYTPVFLSPYGYMQAGVKTGCGNEDDRYKRPIIISVPYRPSIQPFSLKKYYRQFDFKSMINTLSAMGYDVILLKPIQGDKSLEAAGLELAYVLQTINDKKKLHYPNEDWENVVMGFSMGGQVARYALMHMEKKHMEEGTPHHHSRLYIPFDSPHNGANIPMFSQATYLSTLNNIFSTMAFAALTDQASTDMAVSHILGSNIVQLGSNNYQIQPAPHPNRLAFVHALNNNFIHQYTPLNDLRKAYPSFTRNVAVSVGRSDANYTGEFDLNPGMTLYYNDLFMPYIGGLLQSDCSLQSSKYSSNWPLLKIKRKLFILGIVLVTLQNIKYTTKDAYEWDNAQGGYKDEFYDGTQLWLLPIGAVPILRWMVLGFGQKEYKRHMSFMPTVSSLGINPNIWANNNLFYDLKAHNLMYESFYDYTFNIKSNKFGYPNLGHPTNHFNITPFEAVYCDIQTYEHIKMAESIEVDDDELDDAYLVHTRDFILDEVEANDVFLQNKVIGENHTQIPTIYKYRAWYKAYKTITIGNHVSPKTDFGDYIIKKTGDITVHAGREIYLLDGFYAQDGSDFHAYIETPSCARPGITESPVSDNENAAQHKEPQDFRVLSVEESLAGSRELIKVYPNPNEGVFQIEIPREFVGGIINITDIFGKQILEINANSQLIKITDSFARGTYIVSVFRENQVLQTKMTVL